jgi:hypothetical protein
MLRTKVKERTFFCYWDEGKKKATFFFFISKKSVVDEVDPQGVK